MFLEIQSIEMLFSKLKKNRTAPRVRFWCVKFQPTVDFLWQTYESLKIRMHVELLTQLPLQSYSPLALIGFYPRARDDGPKFLSLRGSGPKFEQKVPFVS